MNKYINKLFMMSAIAMAGIMGMTSCTDYLNKAPESDYQDNDPYKNFMNFQGFTLYPGSFKQQRCRTYLLQLW